MKTTIKEYILIFLRGLLMGIADIIPGVSGGTMALVTGIYQRLVHAISSLTSEFVPQFFKGKFKKAFKQVDFALFIPLLLGIAIAFLALSHLMGFLLEEYTAYTFAFFFGLILSSAFFVYKHIGKIGWSSIVVGIIGMVFAFWFVGLNPFAANHSIPILFLSAVIAICAMILPGISGSFILLLLGQYEYLLSVLRNLEIGKIFVFIMGASIGLLAFSRLLDWLLKKFKAPTMAFLTGLMVGSLRLPYTKIAGSGGYLWLIILLALIGFGAVFIIEKKFGNTSKA